MNCCSNFFITRFRQACDDRVLIIAEYLILGRTEQLNQLSVRP